MSTIPRGLLNFPGSTPESKDTLLRLIKEDYEAHHCYFHPNGYHNHLNHHLFAVYDLGASASLLQAVYDMEKKMLWPIDLGKPDITPKPGQIDQNNWTQWLGDVDAYAAYLAFFTKQLEANGVKATLQQYIFSPAANESGIHMMSRFYSGLLHPFIELGFGLEFGETKAVAIGLAHTALHAPAALEISPPGWPYNEHAPTSPNSKSPSLLSLLHEIYQCDDLAPLMPYTPDLDADRADVIAADKKKAAALNAICSKWAPGAGDAKEVDFSPYVQECIVLGTLLLAATSKRGHRTRIDFFLMHAVTSALLLPPILDALPADDNVMRGAILDAWWRNFALYIIARGRPRIDPELLMEATAYPHPPSAAKRQLSEYAVGLGAVEVDPNPWLEITTDVMYAIDPHNIKVIRALMYGARAYGSLSTDAFVRPGEEDLHPGAGKLDGTMFIRAAGLVMDALGWVTHGQKAEEFDRSSLGYDEAWEDGGDTSANMGWVKFVRGLQ
ncbi:hypothetical protein BOTBODRAFT_552378 [Botryobasidium botryosum FD-172 SS1]|uniref:Oxidoreductase AflY n=1 Tax=Botryobasidium botryosum (strain FD-172 SS1) TaxID=930990 RepID=A0A067MR09_BOTB1|nr:hypothetical protein BOTBODRAFT_552378 [Botryobasidium botryosum FD-172 SS1]